MFSFVPYSQKSAAIIFKELSEKEKRLKVRLEKALQNKDTTMFSRGRRLFGLLHSDPRCTSCMAPFEGWGGDVVRSVLNIRRSTMNPLVCSQCEDLVRRLEYGAEVEMSMVFADIRGSTTLAEKMSPIEFKELINKFYNRSTHVLVHSLAVIDKLVGDEVSGYFLPVYAGKEYVMKAIEAAEKILQVTGHQNTEGRWAPVGVGVHAGRAYYGAVSSSDGLVELTALGDAVNTASRLASHAAAGEIVVSSTALDQTGIDASTFEKRTLELKGKADPFDVWVIRITNAQQSGGLPTNY